MTEQLNIDSYCRVCMVQNPDELISLFQIHDSEDDVIANMIIDCTEVMVSDDDNLPQHICRDCLIRLNHAYKLRKQCQRSDEAFRAMLLRVDQQSFKSEMEVYDPSPKLFLASLNEQHFQLLNTQKDYRLVKITGLRCCGCNRIFGNSDELKNHSIMFHTLSAKCDLNTHECTVCGFGFGSRKELTDHEMDLQDLYYVCNQCELMLNTEDDLVQHLKDIHEVEELSQSSEKNVIPSEDSQCDLKLEEELMEEGQEIEYLDEDEDYHEYVDLTMKIKTESANEDSPETKKQLLRTLPGSEFVSRTEEFSKYSIYHLRGERCCGCLRLFVDIESLLIHCDHEHGNRQKIKVAKYQCDVCFQRFGSSLLLSKHKQVAKGKTMYHCKLCDAVLEDERSFIKHIIFTDNHEEVIDAVKIEGKYEEIRIEGSKCCGCDVMCDNEKEMQKHIEELHLPGSVEDDREFKCNRCFKGFHRMNHLARHESDAQKKLSYRCFTERCNYTTIHKRQILKHITTKYTHRNLPRKTAKTHRTDDLSGEYCRYSCCFARCYEVFDSYEELEDHAESVHEMLRIQHTQDRESTQAVCMICLKGFENEQACEKHRSTDRNQKYVCLKCGVQYVSKSTLLQHERSKCGKVAQYQCTQCDKTFVSLGGLRNHQEVHSQKRSHVCDTCGRGFLRKGILKDHINTVHSKVRLFQCSLCPKSFTSRNVFQSHQMTHTKEKPYQCRHCEKRYYKTSDRTMHENQVHLGIRPFQCNFCTASFIRDRERRLHERTHTKTKLYNCDMCSEGYNKFAEYKSHRLKEHGLETLRDLGPAIMAAVRGEQRQEFPGKPHCKLEIEVCDMVE
ncbi:zinc finger protein 14-like [Ochlerotatus camptorhynchus]|uniref:zinc finger protein 14-like n=1 Tax=Ochlerotatus camptorhynchus TaxID=644619 RepID=UPI0031DCB0C5